MVREHEKCAGISCLHYRLFYFANRYIIWHLSLMSPADQIKKKAIDIGFSDVRIGPPEDFSSKLQEWIDLGYHGTMDWITKEPHIRGNPKNMWPEVKSVIAVGLNYGPDHDPLPEMENKDQGYISVYARGDDYHNIVKKKLKELGRFMGRTFGCTLKVFVDTAPVMEKPLAHAAGLGWQGKHTNLVSRTYGSWLFLGIIYTDMDLPFDTRGDDRCGTCRACLDICPTQAFPRPYQLDANKCISYLTIEHKGPIPDTFRTAMGNRIYGCDDCLAACPWNKFAQTARDMAFIPRAALTGPKLADLARLDDQGFKDMFRKSPIKRIGHAQFIRNVLIAIGNSGDKTLIETAQRFMNDPDSTIRDAATWASKQLSK
jgi:epoxyqueuosine reductase